jgi:hypothetical protein
MMNPTQELRRYSFLVKRDGIVKAEAACNAMRRSYIAAARDRRLKHGKHCAYYIKYVESAYSLRYLLRRVRHK